MEEKRKEWIVGSIRVDEKKVVELYKEADAKNQDPTYLYDVNRVNSYRKWLEKNGFEIE